jgi:hypothetical protein
MSRIDFFNSPLPEERDRFIVAISLELTAKAFGPQEWIYIRNDAATEM